MTPNGPGRPTSSIVPLRPPDSGDTLQNKRQRGAMLQTRAGVVSEREWEGAWQWAVVVSVRYVESVGDRFGGLASAARHVPECRPIAR